MKLSKSSMALLLMVIMVASGCVRNTDLSVNGNVNLVATPTYSPATNDRDRIKGSVGKVVGKLESLVLTTKDIPSSFGIFSSTATSNGTHSPAKGYYYAGKDIQQMIKNESQNPGTVQLYIADELVKNYPDFAYDNIEQRVTVYENEGYPTALLKPIAVEQLKGIEEKSGFALPVQKSFSEFAYPNQYFSVSNNNKDWDVQIAYSNAIVSVNLHFNQIISEENLYKIIKQFEAKFKAYIPGDKNDFVQENDDL